MPQTLDENWRVELFVKKVFKTDPYIVYCHVSERKKKRETDFENIKRIRWRRYPYYDNYFIFFPTIFSGNTTRVRYFSKNNLRHCTV